MKNIITEKLELLYEYEKDFFTYYEKAKDMWYNLTRDAMDEFRVHFDLENDDTIHVQRIIEIPQTHWEFTKCKFKCELFRAGGDWEVPALYFRCQLIDGYAYGHTKYNMSHFVFIPGKEQGNNHLTLIRDGKKSGHWSVPDNDGYKNGIDPEPDEKKCWESLKIYLTELVNKEIENSKSAIKENLKGLSPNQEKFIRFMLTKKEL
jgi:hypothetical protein